jgi:transposase
VLRLMTVPGVNVQTAATFMAAIGAIGRFPSARKLVSYLGLDPRVRQSGNSPARHGRISKAGASETRHMLGEVAWKVTLTPGRCARSLNASARDGAARSPRRQSRASSSCCSGTCSSANRTMRSDARR